MALAVDFLEGEWIYNVMFLCKGRISELEKRLGGHSVVGPEDNSQPTEEVAKKDSSQEQPAGSSSEIQLLSQRNKELETKVV